uniref:Uncharacterized protein n=1 Tax=Arundo donax TaxID=35708 RepID=A0A0A9AJ13_ARUDO
MVANWAASSWSSLEAA